MTFSTGTESKLKAKKKPQTLSKKKSLQYGKHEDDKGTLDSIFALQEYRISDYLLGTWTLLF